MRTIAIIPARGGSKRIPGKNIRPFLGIPLIVWSIRFASSYAGFDRVVVSTDSEDIATVCRDAGMDVPSLRPAELATDTAGSADVALDVLEQEALKGRGYDAVALLQPTSPIRHGSAWDAAYGLLRDTSMDATVGIAPVRNHPFHSFAQGPDSRLQKFVEGADLALRTQDLPKAYALTGSLYVVRSAALREHGTFFPPNTAGVVCDDPLEAMDIDTEQDWVIAEALAKTLL